MRIAFYLGKKLINLCSEVPESGIVIGRSRSCDLSVKNENCTKLSRQHARISQSEGKLLLEDLGSSNGTYLNDSKISPNEFIEIKDNDCIRMGDLEALVKNPKTSTGKTTASLKKTGPLYLDKYKFVRALGRGASGDVYLVRHMDTDERFALKMQRACSAVDDQAVKQFQRELCIASQLNHPNIVRCYDTGFQQGNFYYLMDYCNGDTLYNFISRQGRMLPQFALPFAIELLSGLDYAHHAEVYEPEDPEKKFKGIVHRDLKPDNILFHKNKTGEMTIKISDFGLAKAFENAGQSSLTRTGQVSGTLNFMCRQQAVNHKYCGPEVDIWAVAASLFFMLTGRPPRILGENQSPIENLLNTSIPKIGNLRTNIHPELCQLIDYALDDTKDRLNFQLASELKDALKGFLQTLN